MNNQPFYRFKAEAGSDTAELLIFAPIGDWEDFGEVGAKGFAKDLAALPTGVKRLELHINSPGGSVFEASAIYSRLADHKSEKIVYIDGLAASAATIIAMVGHKIYIRANGTMMIHLPSGFAMGNAGDMKKMASALETITESMVNVYEKRTGLARKKIHDLLEAETWFSPDQAVENGFADEVRGVVKAAASLENKHAIFNGVEFDLSRFRNFPTFIGNTQPTNQNTMENPPAARPATETASAAEPPATTTPATATPPVTTATAPPATTATPPVVNEREDGIKAERARINALLQLDRPCTHAIIEAAIKDGKTVADITTELFSAMDKAGQQNDRRSDATEVNRVTGSDSGAAGSGDGLEFGRLIAKKTEEKKKGNPPVIHSRN